MLGPAGQGPGRAGRRRVHVYRARIPVIPARAHLWFYATAGNGAQEEAQEYLRVRALRRRAKRPAGPAASPVFLHAHRQTLPGTVRTARANVPAFRSPEREPRCVAKRAGAELGARAHAGEAR